MGECVLIYGKSGSGKSRSLINFGEEEIAIFNVCGKRLPFPKKFRYIKVSDDIGKICGWISSALPEGVRSVVIDDAGYLMTNKFMKQHATKKTGSGQFDLYNEIADDFWKMIHGIQALPDDLIVYVIMHEDTSDYGETKLRTIGKLLNDKVCIEGMCTIVLRCMVKGKDHIFLTQSTGSDISKSPEGMFPEEIPNDLKAVDDRIREYWGLNPKKEEPDDGKKQD